MWPALLAAWERRGTRRHGSLERIGKDKGFLAEKVLRWILQLNTLSWSLERPGRLER